MRGSSKGLVSSIHHYLSFVLMFCFIVIDDFKSVPMPLAFFILADRDCAESTTHHYNNSYCISLGRDLI